MAAADALSTTATTMTTTLLEVAAKWMVDWHHHRHHLPNRLTRLYPLVHLILRSPVIEACFT